MRARSMGPRPLSPLYTRTHTNVSCPARAPPGSGPRPAAPSWDFALRATSSNVPGTPVPPGRRSACRRWAGRPCKSVRLPGPIGAPVPARSAQGQSWSLLDLRRIIQRSAHLGTELAQHGGRALLAPEVSGEGVHPAGRRAKEAHKAAEQAREQLLEDRVGPEGIAEAEVEMEASIEGEEYAPNREPLPEDRPHISPDGEGAEGADEDREAEGQPEATRSEDVDEQQDTDDEDERYPPGMRSPGDRIRRAE